MSILSRRCIAKIDIDGAAGYDGVILTKNHDQKDSVAMIDDNAVRDSEALDSSLNPVRIRQCFNGHNHPMPSTSSEDFLDKMIYHNAFDYQDGMCAELAHALIRMIPDSRWVDVWSRKPIHEYDEPIHHAVMLNDGRILDSLGLWSAEEMRLAWGSEAVIKVFERNNVDMETPVTRSAQIYGLLLDLNLDLRY